MSIERLNAAVERLTHAVEAAVEHMHEPRAEAPADESLHQAVVKVEDLTNKLESRVPDAPAKTADEAPVETTAAVPAEVPAEAPTGTQAPNTTPATDVAS